MQRFLSCELTSLKKWLTFSSYYSTKKFSHFHCRHVLITNDVGFFWSHTIVLRITSQFCVSVMSELTKSCQLHALSLHIFFTSRSFYMDQAEARNAIYFLFQLSLYYVLLMQVSFRETHIIVNVRDMCTRRKYFPNIIPISKEFSIFKILIQF